jgi:hypothetical protein
MILFHGRSIYRTARYLPGSGLPRGTGPRQGAARSLPVRRRQKMAYMSYKTRLRESYGLFRHGPNWPVRPGPKVKEHDYTKRKSGLVYFLPQPTKLYSITEADDEEHFTSGKALLVEGVAFQEIDNTVLIPQIVEAWGKADRLRPVKLVLSSLHAARQLVVKALVDQHSALVRGHVQKWLKNLVPNMQLSAVYRLVRIFVLCRSPEKGARSMSCSTTLCG